jgi:hypothetical protein
MTPLAEADYTPVSLQFIPEPLVTWADLRGVRFDEPFFRDTLERLSRDRYKGLTGIEGLRALDHRPTLAPALFVFQVSRCGSTLLAQMLATLATNVVISESNVIGELLGAHPAPARSDELLGLLVRAMGRNRGGDARHLVVKFSSWNVLFADMIHRAFPDTPLVWLQREPLQVVASQAQAPAAWCRWREQGNPALAMFGLTVDEAQGMSSARFRLHAIEALYRAALDARLPWLVVDYAELPSVLWERIAGHARLSFDAAEVARMRERARFDSKRKPDDGAQPRPYVARDRAPAVTDEERRFVTERIEPLYRAIGHQKSLELLGGRNRGPRPR